MFYKNICSDYFYSKVNTQESDNMSWWSIALEKIRPQVETGWSNSKTKQKKNPCKYMQASDLHMSAQ